MDGEGEKREEEGESQGIRLQNLRKGPDLALEEGGMGHDLNAAPLLTGVRLPPSPRPVVSPFPRIQR